MVQGLRFHTSTAEGVSSISGWGTQIPHAVQKKKKKNLKEHIVIFIYLWVDKCWRIDVFELWCWRRLLRVPWTARRSNQSILKEISAEYSLKDDADAETPILWPLDVKNWLIWKDPDSGNDWRQEEKGTTEDEMVGWHHWLNGHKFE